MLKLEKMIVRLGKCVISLINRYIFGIVQSSTSQENNPTCRNHLPTLLPDKYNVQG